MNKENAVELSEILTLASETRNSSDYDDFYIISKEEVNIQIQNADRLFRDIENYLNEKYHNQ